MMAWISTDFFGGMLIWLLYHGLLIIPLVLLYIFSIFDTVLSLINQGKRTSKIKLTAHAIVLISICALNLFHSEVFKSESIITAVLKDDLNHYRLILRKNGNVENQTSGMLGFSQTFYGKYKIDNDLIIFSEKPGDNDFIPDTLLIDKEKAALFLEKDSRGNFRTEKEWLNHFEIEEI